MASLINKTIRVRVSDFKKMIESTKKIKIRKDEYQNKYMSIEDIYFNRLIGRYLPSEYDKNELYLAKRLYKCLVLRVYNAKDMSIDNKKEYLDEYNWSNLRLAVINTVNVLKEEGVTNRNIVFGDITRLPFDNLFYDFEIKAKDELGNEVIKTLKTILTFATGDVEMGYQEGFRDENGNTIISKFKPSSGEVDKCYITLNYIKDYTPNSNKSVETMAVYYYLGNTAIA